MPLKAPAAKVAPKPARAIPTTRVGTSPLAGHFPIEHARAFRALAASQGKDVQELLAEAINMAFKRYALPNRIEISSGRRTRREA